MAQQKAVIKIPKAYGPLERRAIADKIIDKIIKRTQSGEDINNKKFNSDSSYSKAYKNSKEFSIGGKTSKIDLTLSGEMLNALEPLRSRSGSITVGIPKDDKRNNDKAEGNQKGTYGNKRPVTKPRKFIGLSQNDLDSILKKFPVESSLEKAARLVAARQAARALAEGDL